MVASYFYGTQKPNQEKYKYPKDYTINNKDLKKELLDNLKVLRLILTCAPLCYLIVVAQN